MNPDLVPMLLDVSIDPCDGSVHPSLQYVLIRGFTAMGWEQPRSASEDMAMEILKMIRPSRPDAVPLGGVRSSRSKEQDEAIESLRTYASLYINYLPQYDNAGRMRVRKKIDASLATIRAALSTPSDAVNESAEVSIEQLLDETECKDIDDLRDMAMVGHATMAAVEVVIESDGPFKDWSPAQCPSEIITDLFCALMDDRRPDAGGGVRENYAYDPIKVVAALRKGHPILGPDTVDIAAADLIKQLLSEKVALSTPSDTVNESAPQPGNSYYTIQSALSPHMASSTELMAAMSSIWPLIKSPSVVNESAEARLREALDCTRRALVVLRVRLSTEPTVQGRSWIDLGIMLNNAVDKADNALSAGGDEAKKSEGGVEGHAKANATGPKLRSERPGSPSAIPTDYVAAGIKPGPSDPTADRREIVARATGYADRIRWLLQDEPGSLSCALEMHREARGIMETFDAILAALAQSEEKK